MSTIKGYEVGEIPCKAAVTADMIMDERADLPSAVNAQDMSRLDMGLRKGMYIKYVPYTPHPVTGTVMVGGRYLFDTWEDVVDYDRWTTNEYEVGDPPSKFWDWPMFKKVDRWIWRVVGAHHFSHPETHGLHRLQRWSFEGGDVEGELREAWPAIRDAAKELGAGGVWLLWQPDAKLISLFTVMRKPEPLTKEAIYDAHESLRAQTALAALLPAGLKAKPIFDRTSLNMAIWLPVSRAAGGTTQITPLHPVLPEVTTGHGSS